MQLSRWRELPGRIRPSGVGGWATAGLVLGFVVSFVSMLPGVRNPGQEIAWIDSGLVNLLQLGSAALCLGTGWQRRQKPWLIVGAGLAAWAIGDLYWQVVLADLDPIPYPSLADALFLAMYPAAYVAVVLLLRSRLTRFQPSMWLDGAIGALGSAALVASLAFGSILQTTGGDFAVVATNLAYPIGDLLLLSLVVGAFGLLGLRPGLRWWLLGGGFLAFGAADTVYLWQTAQDTYETGTLVDSGWVAGLLLIALACRFSESKAPSEREMRGWTVLAVPSVFALTSIGLLAVDTGSAVPSVAVWLGLATVIAGVARVVLTFREVQALAESRLQARSDDLTGLANRRGFYEHAERLLERSRDTADGRPFALLLIDLDRFKEVNDSLGHHAGDTLLISVGRRLGEALRGDGDVLARLGGDEFAVLLDGADEATARTAAARLHAAMSRPVEIDGVRLHVDGSFGIALHPGHGDEVPVLLQRADIAMYSAKSSTDVPRTAVYTLDDDVRTRDRLQTIGELRRALAGDELVLHYQPKIDVPTGAVHGVEALIRWQHPVRGLLFPDSFLTLVEEGGLMRDLTVRVLDLALDQARRWHDAGVALSVAVNLSAASVVDTELPGLIASMVAQHGVPPEVLVLEITEDFLLDRTRAREVLADLRSRGYRIGIDDYGSGYSSLAYLRELPVDDLKLDRSFVLGMDDDPRAAAIVASTIGLAHSLGLRLVAEGVETATSAAALREMGCDEAQGYHFSRPVPVAELERWLAQRMPALPVPRPEPAAAAVR